MGLNIVQLITAYAIDIGKATGRSSSQRERPAFSTAWRGDEPASAFLDRAVPSRLADYHLPRPMSKGSAYPLTDARPAASCTRAHLDPAARYGIPDGDRIRIETPNGGATGPARAPSREDATSDVLATPMGWWYSEVPGFDHWLLTVDIEGRRYLSERWLAVR